MQDCHVPDEGASARPSRSQKKREAEDLQRLGERLLALPSEELGRLPLGDSLREAIDLAQRISSRSGLRRQRQLIGKLMRAEDAGAIENALEAVRGASVQETARHHAAEQWRNRMLDEDEGITAFMAAYPGADQQQLRQLIRKAREEQRQSRPPRAFRELYRLIHRQLSGV